MKLKILCITMIFALVACKNVSNQSKLDSVVDQEVFTKAQTIIDNLDYIPFDQTEDGCWSRAIIMAMELAANRIPSSSVLVIGSDLKSPAGTKWFYHISLIFKVKETGDIYVIDPGYSPVPLRPEVWTDQFVNGDYSSRVQPGSVRDNEDIFLDSNNSTQIKNAHEIPNQIGSILIKSISEMPKFKITNIKESFKDLWFRVAIESLTNKETDSVRQERLVKMTKRVKELLALLSTDNLIEYEEHDEIWWQEYFVEFEGLSAKNADDVADFIRRQTIGPIR